MRNRKKYDAGSRFYCTHCGKENYSIIRRNGRSRESGHLKKLWCFNCQAEHNCVEVKEFTHYSKQDFDFEFENGNFSKAGDRILPYGEFRAKMHSEGKELP